jgi:phosphopantothenoylcysteine decarboxylase/phosphopantothenate--cysteine ligase
MHFLITAGGTREYIDPVRFISNASSGRMGYALAAAALRAGHKVTLITTVENSKLKTQNSKLLKIVKTESAALMFNAVKKYFVRCDCLIMAAAVADYTPLKKSKIKIKKANKNLVVKLKPTVDILKWAGKSKKKNQVVVGFALEDKNLRPNAEKKLKEKNLDMIIANTTASIGADKSSVEVKISNRKWVKFPQMTKTEIAGRIISLIESVPG